jgi:hypothetical protein
MGPDDRSEVLRIKVVKARLQDAGDAAHWGNQLRSYPMSAKSVETYNELKAKALEATRLLLKRLEDDVNSAPHWGDVGSMAELVNLVEQAHGHAPDAVG